MLTMKFNNVQTNDNSEYYELDFWSGVIPIKLICEYLVADEKLKAGIEIPPHVLEFYENNKNGF